MTNLGHTTSDLDHCYFLITLSFEEIAKVVEKMCNQINAACCNGKHSHRHLHEHDAVNERCWGKNLWLLQVNSQKHIHIHCFVLFS